jgi:murein DD-endopeptidase MepM/ murein hydrolase activator NlpD
MGLFGCSNQRGPNGGGGGYQNSAVGVAVASGGTGAALPSAGNPAGGGAPTGGSGTGGSLPSNQSSGGSGDPSSGGAGTSAGTDNALSGSGGSAEGKVLDELGGAEPNGASGTETGATQPSRAGAGGAPSSGRGDTGGTADTGGSSTGGGVEFAGTAGADPSGAGSGAGPVAATGGARGSAAGGTAGGSDGSDAGAGGATPTGLSWPIDCVPGESCAHMGLPDIDDNGLVYDCSTAALAGHEGTDIAITWEQMDAGVAVRAAADGEVFFASDGKYDRCPNAAVPDCQRPAQDLPGDRTGTNVCTDYGPYCGTGTGSCFWCFSGGNVVVILHEAVRGVFATRYDHLRQGSVRVRPGARVVRGQVIGEVGSAGNSTEPHLHFEVWGTGYYELADPWAGPCGPNLGPSLWAYEPPWG